MSQNALIESIWFAVIYQPEVSRPLSHSYGNLVTDKLSKVFDSTLATNQKWI